MAKNKKIIIWVAIIAVVAGFLFFKFRNNKKNQTSYETAKVERGDLAQTVEATGKVESLNDLSLRFEVPGIIDKILVKEGQKVKAGDAIANLRLGELNAAVAQASANLNQKIAGATQAEKDYYKAVVDQAKADWDKSKSDTTNLISVAESALETAKNNLELAAGGEKSQIVLSAYEDAVSVLQSSLTKLDDGLVQADNILGIDNTSANDDIQPYLSVSDPNKLFSANSQYGVVKNLVAQVRLKITPLTSGSASAEIDIALSSAIDTFTQMSQLLVMVSDALNATVTGGSFTTASLSVKKTTIDTARTSINTQYTNLINQRQAIASAKNSYQTYSIAYDKAVKDLADTRNSVAATLKIKEAVYNQALANYQNKINPTRDVDLAYYRAALWQAAANRNKAIIKAPIDGIVTVINKKAGELVTSADEIVRLFSPHFEIKVDVPEADISKLGAGDEAQITLDAFGEEFRFSGKVANIEAGSTEIQDVVYYKVTITLDDSDKEVKPGMTANIKIKADFKQQVLYIPLRAVRTDDDNKKFVRVPLGADSEDVYVKIGMKGDDGKVEILEGLKEGQVIIVSIIKK